MLNFSAKGEACGRKQEKREDLGVQSSSTQSISQPDLGAHPCQFLLLSSAYLTSTKDQDLVGIKRLRACSHSVNT